MFNKTESRLTILKHACSLPKNPSQISKDTQLCFFRRVFEVDVLQKTWTGEFPPIIKGKGRIFDGVYTHPMESRVGGNDSTSFVLVGNLMRYGNDG